MSTQESTTGQSITDKFERFFATRYRDEIGELAQSYPKDRNSLWVEYAHLYSFDPDVAEDWLTNPGRMQEAAEEALGLVDLPIDVGLEDATVRLTDTEELLDRKSVAGLSEADLGTYVAIRGQLNRVTDTIPLLEVGAFVCVRCGMQTEIAQSRTSSQEPHECRSCDRQGPFRLDLGQSTFTDIRKLKLEEPPEEQVDAASEDMPALVDGDLVHVGGENGLPDRSGERVTVLGELTLDTEDLLDGNDGPEGEPYLNATAIVFDERDDAATIDYGEFEDDLAALRERAGDDLIEAYRDSIAPTIMAEGDEDLQVALEALVAYLFNGYRLDPEGHGSKRGDLHIGIIGDPGRGKTQVLSRVAQLSPTCEFRSGTGVTKVGLTAAAVQEEFFGSTEWTLRPGILPRGNGGHTIIDEIDAAVDEKTKAIHDALEGEQLVKVDKAGIRADLPTRTALCVSGNPDEGRFDPHRSLADQVDMDPALISRMDGLFALKDVPDPDYDSDVAWHVLDSFDELADLELAERLPEAEPPADVDTVEPPIATDVFKAAIAWAQDNVHPRLTPAAKTQLAEFYVEARQLNDDDGDVIPATARTLEAGIRFSMAFARAEFCEEVTVRHAERAIRISKHVVGLSFDPSTGKFDVSRVDEGTPQSQKTRRRQILKYVSDHQPDDSTGGVSIDELVEELTEQWGAEASTLRHDVQKLKEKRGQLYSPAHGEVRRA